MPVPTPAADRLSPQEIAHLSTEQIIPYLPQLQQLDFDSFDRRFIEEAIGDPDFRLGQSFIHIMRDIMLCHCQQIERIVEEAPLYPQTTVTEIFLTQSTTTTPTRFISNLGRRLEVDCPPFELRIVRPVEVPSPATRSINLLPSWETAYTLEENGEDFSNSLERASIPAGDMVTVPLPAPHNKTLKQIAELIPAGVLGMQYDGDRSPYNLVLRPKNENDPGLNLLKGFGWFEVKNHKQVLWAAATLEAYNTLIESGVEFTQSHKVEKWWQYINSDEQLPYFSYFDDDCPLFDYQKEAVQFLMRRKRAMLALSPGLGKTLTAAYAASLHSSIRRVLLVCPASLLYYWYSELKKWESVLRQKPLVEIWHKETGTLPQTLPENTQFWAITNPETVSRYTEEFILDDQGAQNFWDLLIVDESIMYKHRDSKRSAALNRLAGAVPDMWELTGAPATRFLDDMWHQFHMLSNRGYASYWRFAESYCRIDDNEFSRSVIANRRGAESLIKTNFRDVYFARSQDQVADIPDWLFVDMDIAMKPKQEAVYRKLQKELRVVIVGHDDWEEVQVDDRLALTLRSLQVASNPVLLGADNSSGKWSSLPDLMEIYPGPYLVWVNFIRTGEMLKESLRSKFGSDRVELANGSTPVIERQRLVDHFQAEGLDVLILNSQVGKFGFTLTRARTSFFVERGYDDSYFQCLHRNRRIGTVFAPIVVNMRSVTIAGGRTIDHVVHDALDYRTGMIKRLTMGDLRKVIEEDE